MPSTWEVFTTIGHASDLINQRRWAEAVSVFEDIYDDLGPSLTRYLAQIYLHLGEWEKAARTTVRADELDMKMHCMLETD